VLEIWQTFLLRLQNNEWLVHPASWVMPYSRFFHCSLTDINLTALSEPHEGGTMRDHKPPQ